MSGSVFAQDRPAVVVSDPNEARYRTAVQQFAILGAADRAAVSRAEALRAAIERGLEFSALFESIDPEAFLAPVSTTSLQDRPTCASWSQIGTDALVEGEIELEAGGDRLVVEHRVSDVARGCRMLLRHRYRGGLGDLDVVARRIADDVVGAFTGRQGVASTEIALVSDRSGVGEIYVMNADGSSLRQATRSGAISQFPAWHPRGDSIVYSSYRDGGRPRLFLLARDGGASGRILDSVDPVYSQYRAVFDPAGKRLALVMSRDGSSEIFTATRGGGRLEAITRNRAIDISPSWSPDGRQIVFVSDRAGSPQLYRMDRDGGEVRRLTFDGSYNTSPAWSPDGQWIAYEARVKGQFDIWLIDPEGEVNVPLVSHPRSDESPTWSPDSRKIAFSSTRLGRADIFQVDLDGRRERRITDGSGTKRSPAWGPYPR